MLRLALVLVLMTPAMSLAENMVPRDDDTLIPQTDLDTRLRGSVITFFDDGASEFFADGRYTYTYANDGGTGYGYFKVTADSEICIDFVTGFSRCDLYVIDTQDRLVVITEKGDRFPVRPN